MNSKIFSFLPLLCLCAIGHAARQEFPWTVSLTVSNVPGVEYEGEVEILTIFKDKTQHAVIFPSTKYRLGRIYTFPVSLAFSSAPEAVFIRTKGLCPLGPLPMRVLRLTRVDLVSSTKVTYSKRMNDLAIKDACQPGTRGTVLTDFAESGASSCLGEDGRKYIDGEDFNLGCTGRCKCENGSIACVSMCPPQTWGPGQKCYFVHKPGQCCDQIVCQQDSTLEKCREARPGILMTDDNKAVRRYPWSVLFCTNTNCTSIHGGIILGERRILTFARHLGDYDKLFVASGQYIVDQANISDFTLMNVVNVSTHIDFINPDSPFADSASRLQVVEFEQSFSFDRLRQPANLPFDEVQCAALSENSCPMTTVGWDLTDDTDDTIRQWFLHADRTRRDETLCRPDGKGRAEFPRRRGDERACVGGMVRQDCTGPMGGAVVANAADIDFVIGVTDPDSALFSCSHPGTADVLPLCKYVGWVNQIIGLN